MESKDDAEQHRLYLGNRLRRMDEGHEALSQHFARLSADQSSELHMIAASIEQKVSVQAKATSDIVERLCALASTVAADSRAEVARLDALDTHVQRAEEDLALRASRAEFEDLAVEVHKLQGTVAQKAGVDDAVALDERLANLSKEVAKMTTKAQHSELGDLVRRMGLDVSQKAEHAVVVDLEDGLRRLRKDVSERAPDSGFKELCADVSDVKDVLRLKADDARVDDLDTVVKTFRDKLDVWWTRALAFQKLPDDTQYDVRGALARGWAPGQAATHGEVATYSHRLE